MQVSLTISEIGMMILWAALMVLIVFLIILAKRAIDVLKNVTNIISTNEESLTNTIGELPSILHNVDEITGELSHDVKAVRSTVDTITEKSSIAADSLEDIDSVIAGVTTVIQSGLFLKDLYDRNIKFPKSKR